MKTSAIATTLVAALCATFASAGVVITPIHQNQLVDTLAGDCFFGKSTPWEE
ncbi:uncharacterized protein GGS22DRAFT_189695 [Annulohypoxylon maeteangense]|uniref:uncharacterized protein n=1 Tax=Annulohypoxylon maeteangense TaxID=1927788 RepID=UPI002008809F|nr:uncharacterized protein GGS22DRAFT_189695 [Annulohypoxylon maeteangense]KAI0883729.1 hypothetical protein GGS22DRAFT_189695 [Annulohypoxylon maeteangense]